MRARWLVIFLLVALLAVPLAGCGSRNDDRDAPGASQEAGLDEDSALDDESDLDEVAEPDVDGQDDGEPAAVGLDTLDSYRQTVTTRATTDGETTEWTTVTEYVREPRAMRVQWTSLGADGDADGWETVRIGDVTYIRGSGGSSVEEWMAYTSDDMDEPEDSADLSNWMNAADYLSDPNCERGRAEDVDGHSAVRYACNKGVYAGPAGIWGITGQLTDGGIETWISKEFDVAVKTINWWAGEDDDGVQHEFYAEGVITSINQPITIEAPADAKAPGLPDDVPVMPGATVTLAMMGMVGFEVDAELEDVLAFYKEEMDTQGWSLETDAGEMLSYSKDGRTATIMLVADEDKVSGTVIVSEE